MTQPALEFFRKRGLIGKIETVEGTDEVPVVASDGILLMNGSSGTEFDTIERSVDRTFFTHDPFVVGNKRAFIEGEFELFAPSNPGVGASANDVILRTGGLAKTLTVGNATTTGKTRYAPVSTAIPSASFHWWHVDYLKKVLGARTAISRLSLAIGNRFVGACRILGNYTDVTEDTIAAITTYTSVPVVCRHDNSTMTVTDVTGAGSPITLWGKELSVDLGSQLGSKEFTSKKINAISDRRPTFTMRFARTDLSDINFWTLRDAGNIITATFRLDEGTGLYSELGIRGQIEQVNEVDVDGDLCLEITGRCIASSSGGDELYVEFGDTTAAGTA